MRRGRLTVELSRHLAMDINTSNKASVHEPDKINVPRVLSFLNLAHLLIKVIGIVRRNLSGIGLAPLNYPFLADCLKRVAKLLHCVFVLPQAPNDYNGFWMN